MNEESLISQSPPSRAMWLWSVGIAFVVVAIAAVIYFYVFLQMQESESRQGLPAYLGHLPRGLIASREAGDWKGMLDAKLAIQNNPASAADEKALAVLNSFSGGLRLSGSIKEMKAEIQELKTVFLDTNVSNELRIAALNILAVAYCDSGLAPEIFDEVFKDEPFHSYLVSGDREMSMKQLLDWSYSTLPTYFSAVRLARWYSGQVALKPDLPETVFEQYVAETERYLQISYDLAAQELATNPGAARGVEYATYRYSRAIVIGRLAVKAGEPYKSQYQNEFENAISFMENRQGVSTDDMEFFLRHIYAEYLLKIDKDTETAKSQVEILVRGLNALENPLSSYFVQYLRNLYKYERGSDFARNVERQMKLSSEFNTLVKKLVAIP